MIAVVSGTSPFRRNHGRAKRMGRGAFPAKSWAIEGFGNPTQDLPSDTKRRFVERGLGEFEPGEGIEAGIFRSQTEPRKRDSADTAPLSVHRFEDLKDHFLGYLVAFFGDKTWVGVGNLVLTSFELLDGHQNTRREVDRFKARDDDGYLILLSDGQVFMVAHYSANVTSSKEALDAIGRV